MSNTTAYDSAAWLAENFWQQLGCGLSMSARSQVDSTVPLDDAQDVRATLDGDQEAFGRLVARHQEAITRQMRRFSRHPQVVEELVHDVFVEAFLSLKSYGSRAPLLHWLRRIAVRTGYRYWQQQSRRPPTVCLSELNERLRRAAERATSAAEAGEMLGDLLDPLPPRDRLVLTLMYWDGCTVAEVAEFTGWSRSMVKVQAHRARRRLKRLIEDANQ